MDGQKASPQTTCKPFRLLLRLALALWLGVMAVVAARAERLSVKVYTTADGLVSNRISRIIRDSRGFLWFCTEEGLSKFDGYTFTNYTTEQGLPDNWVNDLLETRGGQYWVATERGLCKFNPQGAPIPQTQIAKHPGVAPMFTVWRPSDDPKYSMIRSLYEDREGRIWAGAWRGFYRVEEAGGQVRFHQVELERPADYRESFVVRNIVEDEAGNLWLGTSLGLYQFSPDGRRRRYTMADGLTGDNITALVKDKQGRLWVGANGTCQIVPAPEPDAAIAINRFTAKEISSCPTIGALFQSADGSVWIGTDCGLLELSPDSKEVGVRLDAETMNNPSVWSLGEDINGNLWVGAPAGAIRITRGGFAAYAEKDGLGARRIYQVIEARTGEIVAFTYYGDNCFIAIFDGRRFISRRFNRPEFAVSAAPYIYQDRKGGWWLYSQNKLYRFAKVNSASDLIDARLVAEAVALDSAISGFHEDQRGDFWLATPSHPKHQVVRWERATGSFHAFSGAEGPSPDDIEKPGAFSEDNEGNIWIGYVSGEIGRFRNGRFELISSVTGTLGGRIVQLRRDSAGRIWIAGEKYGLRRIDNPTADRSQLIVQSFTGKLSSNLVYCIEEEAPDRFYIGTSRGLDHLDLQTGGVRRYTTADGLASDEINGILRDHRGAFWFKSGAGLSRLLPRESPPPPPIFINRLLIAGREKNLSELGERDLSGLELPPGRNQIEIEFASLAFDGADAILYQYKLEGADADWSGYTSRRSVNYANLKPGDYRFLVRAVNAEGALSEAPASAQFRVPAPFWQRWWFLALAATAMGLAVYGLYRYRVARLVEIERVRTRIATDLHDDIGSNLSLIAGLSRFLRDQIGERDPGAGERLSVIAQASSRSVEAMSDIIWAVNPRKDHLSDLSQRMRRFASDAFTARDIEFSFTAPDLRRHTRVDAETRREVFLIFKEALNNAVRHSACSHADVTLEVDHGKLVLKVSDNGKGFDQQAAEYGNGVMSMKARADKLGGRLEITSAPGQGATVTLTAPLRH